MGRIHATVSDALEDRLRRYVFERFHGHLYRNVSRVVEEAIERYLDEMEKELSDESK